MNSIEVYFSNTLIFRHYTYPKQTTVLIISLGIPVEKMKTQKLKINRFQKCRGLFCDSAFLCLLQTLTHCYHKIVVDVQPELMYKNAFCDRREHYK